jgi:hypothetical protein
MMHQVALIVAASLKALDVICPMFCACTLMHIGTTRKRLMDRVRAEFKSRLDIVHNEDTSAEPFLLSLFQQLNWAEGHGTSAGSIEMQRARFLDG